MQLPSPFNLKVDNRSPDPLPHPVPRVVFALLHEARSLGSDDLRLFAMLGA